MAKIGKLPGTAVISGFKGVIDYYLWKGIACVRKWPRSPGHDRAPAVEAQWAPFAWSASNWNTLSPAIQDAWRQLATGTPKTGRDLFTQSFITPKYLNME